MLVVDCSTFAGLGEVHIMADRPTLLKPPEWDPNKAPIENVLDVTELAVLGPVSS